MPAADVIGATVSAAFAPDGTLWRLTPRASWVEVDRSTDFGATFGPPIRLHAGRQRIRAHPEDRPQIGADADGRIYIVFAADAPQPWTRYLAISTDAGRTFAAPVPLSTRAAQAIQHQPALHVTSRGAQVFWIEHQHQETKSHPDAGVLYGKGITTPVPSRELRLHEGMCECCRIATASDAGGGTQIFARLVLNGTTRDHGIITLNADGSAPAARRVTDDEWNINACPQSGPTLAISATGRYHLAWFTQGRRRQGLFYARSDDAATTLSAPIPLGSPASRPTHAHLSAAGTRIALAWMQFDGKTTAIHAMTSADDGASWSEDQLIGTSTQAADYPFVLTHAGRFYVSWYAADTGYRLIPLPLAGAT